MLTIPAGLLAACREHARRDAPRECCGYLLGRPGRVTDCRPAQNRAAVPSQGYALDASEHLRVELEARRHGVTVLGFYHSHPRGPARPSGQDLAQAHPGYAYLIVGQDMSASAWRGHSRQLVPVALEEVV